MSYNGPQKASRGRTIDPSRTWLDKCAAARDNAEPDAPRAHEIVKILWQEGYGPIATARILDWYNSSHPEAIERSKTDEGKKDEEG